MKLLLAPLLTAMLSASALGAPRVLIFQEIVPEATQADVDDYLAQSLDERGRVQSIVWSMADPIFRNAVLDGTVKLVEKKLSTEQLLQGAQALGCEFIIKFNATQKGPDVTAKAVLLQRGKQVWADERKVSSGRESTQDLENVLRSLASTWTMLLEGGPFKTFAVQPKTVVPDPPAGEIPIPVGEDPPKPAESENAKLFANIDALERAKKITEAITSLRDAIDATPLDPERRIRLIELLLRAGRHIEAAEEARRSSKLLPEVPAFRVLAASAWVRAGRPEAAAQDLAETLAADPKNVVARRMLAEIALRKLHAAEAIGHLDIAISAAPDASLHFLRAVAKALAKDVKGLEQDLEAARKFEIKTDLSAMEVGAAVLDDSFDFSVNDVRSLMQRALVRRQEREVVDAAADHSALTNARRRLLELWLVPPSMQLAHGKRQLATNLLAQALGGLKSFLADGVEDTLTEARIDLGEAIRQAKEARKAAESRVASEGTDGRTTNAFH